jgi:winged helix DNA-binding protein
VGPRTLTARELNRSLLARQLLLGRASTPIPRAIERIGGLQTQYAPSGYVGLWSRVADLDRVALTSALERKNVVQGTVMRATIHMVSRGDYPLMSRGVRDARRAWWVRAARADSRSMAALARRLRSLLADGPRRGGELVAALGIDTGTWNGLGLWVDLVRVPPSGTWERRRADLYATADSWLGTSDVTGEDGVDLLVRRYLAAFGPASAKDVASWTGLSGPALAAAFARIPLRTFRDERGGELLDVRRAPLPDPETPAPVRFLPTWDATLLVHARRTQILPESYRPRVFNTKTPHSVATFLVDGQVAGTWAVDGGGVRTAPFERLPARIRREVDDEAERLTAFHR